MVSDAETPAKRAYKVAFNKKNFFKLDIKNVSAGLSFLEAGTVLDESCSTSRLKKTGGVHEQNVCELVRVATAVNLKRIADILNNRKCWAFSIAFDGHVSHRKSFIVI